VNRRNFLSLTMGILVSRLWGQGRSRWDLSLEEARDLPEEDFWEWVRFQFPRHPTLINLNNGGVSPHPKLVQEMLWRLELAANEAPAYIMWRVQDLKELLRQRLAELAGADPEEIAIVRNTTEALETVIFGLDLRRGDEVIAAESDYPSMVAAWQQRGKAGWY
jgi:selenocysteine lyase/cysteine desulfurase